MAVNGIGQGYYGNYYGSTIISALYRMQQRQSVQSTQSVQEVTRSSALNRSNVTRYMDSSSTNFLKEYNSSMADLMKSGSALRSANSSLWNKMTVSSSDASVLDVQQNYRLSTQDTYKVNVKQLAQGQEMVSNGMASDGMVQTDMVLSLSSTRGSASFNVQAQDQEGNFKTNEEMLKELAEVVNQSDIGVKASVSTKDGVSSLTLASAETGKESAFKVEGKFAEENGLNKVSKEAQDAVYTVSKNGRKEQEFTSADNKVSMDFGRMDATFKKTGNVTIQANVDQENIVSAVSDLVKSYNNTISMLQENADRGSGVVKQLNNMKNTGMSEYSMKLIGITRDDSGKMTLDEEKLKESLQTNPSFTKELLGGSFGLAQMAFEDGRQGLSQSGASLLQNDIQSAMESYYTDPIQMLGMYNRSGSYTMTNLFTIGNYIDMFL